MENDKDTHFIIWEAWMSYQTSFIMQSMITTRHFHWYLYLYTNYGEMVKLSINADILVWTVRDKTDSVCVCVCVCVCVHACVWMHGDRQSGVMCVCPAEMARSIDVTVASPHL